MEQVQREGDKDRRKENSWAATAIIQVKDDSGLDLADSTAGGEQWSESEYAVQVEQEGFANRLDMNIREDSRKTLRILV